MAIETIIIFQSNKQVVRIAMQGTNVKLYEKQAGNLQLELGFVEVMNLAEALSKIVPEIVALRNGVNEVTVNDNGGSFSVPGSTKSG